VPGDDGFHVAVNAAPDKGIFLDALSRLVPGGAFCFFSGLVGESSIPMKLFNEIHYRQLRLAGAYGCTRDQMRRALDLLTAYRGTAALLIQEKIRMEEVPGKWDQILSGKGYRIVVEMQP
jgi:D-arabinose 1-dehydrogenase-like Zn-dependent alcohol dehydrogenase